ncbi:MAG TPA: ABC transporter ATP-binding protein [Opitutaceae bacterium]|jgi:ABC-type dipeptide/oligopeptide/nickel transport system ATPase component|nr:ABC transporter ATP-binding protein [Opitutaceae bacterium]
MKPEAPLLEVDGLRVVIGAPGGAAEALRDVSFCIARGETLALVGESGSGKTMTAHAIMRLLPPPARITDGRIVLHSRAEGEIDLTALRDKAPVLRRVRGGLVSMIFQEPMTALSPVHTVGNQVMEAIRVHRDLDRADARRRTLAMLEKVGIPDSARRFDCYPHELSGGLRQRAIIAMALVCRPELLIADEPTAALDLTIQAQILGLIRAFQREIGCSVLLITHDFGIVAHVADRVAVLHLGEVVESGKTREILCRPRHPYTRALLSAQPGRRTRTG